MLPPFYYKGIPTRGCIEVAEVIERVGDARLQLYLIISPVAVVPITLGLIERLLKAIWRARRHQDSSGD
jgi:hypothetical protein